MKNLAILLLMFSAAAWARDLRGVGPLPEGHPSGPTPSCLKFSRDDALKNLPPWIQYYNRLKGQPKLSPWQQDEPESLNVRLVGKWGRGPAARVPGRDSLVYLALGSEVAIFNAADGHNPRVIAEIQCRNITGRLCLKDTFLFVGVTGSVDVYSIANPANPRFVCHTPATGGELSVSDSMAYVLGSDSLYIYNVADPANWQRRGATRDSGYSLNVSGGFAYLADRWGLYIVDCTDPANPHWASTLSGGVETRASCAEGGYCYYTEMYPDNNFVVADVSDPYHPSEVGRLPGYGGYDVQKLGFFVYLPGYAIIDVSNPSSPTLISNLLFGGDKWGIWTRSPYSYSFVASGYEGLVAVNIADPVHPVVDTTIAGADDAIDVSFAGALASIANDRAGMKVLDIENPTAPSQIGNYDTTGVLPHAQAVSVRDSFAYLATIATAATGFRSIALSDPRNPILVGYCEAWNPGRAIALRDTFAYMAEDYKLEVFSIANPRNPRLVGSCTALDMVGGLCLQGDYAYEESGFGLGIIDVSDPASPQLVSTTPGHPTNSWGVAVTDSFAYVPSSYDSLWVFNVRDPYAPFPVGHVRLGNSHGYDVVVHGNRAYVGCYDFRVFDISDPVHPILIGYYATPYRVRRVYYAAPYIYAACFGGGVCIFETTTTTGVAESRPVVAKKEDDRFRVAAFPNPAQDEVELQITPRETKVVTVKIADVTGRKLIEVRLPVAAGKAHLVLPRGMMPSGVYFLTARSGAAETTVKVVKR